MTRKYDEKDYGSVVSYAKLLVNKSLSTACQNLIVQDSGKGRFGQFLEKYYFELDLNSESRPDFEHISLELKSSSLKKLKKCGSLRSKERVVLGIIDYESIVNESFDISNFVKKNSKLLFVFYLSEKSKLPIDYIIKLVDDWVFDEVDLEVIRRDWEAIKEKVSSGNAHLLTESETFYLAASTKGANKKNKRKQPFSNELAMQRAYSLKQGYVNHVIARIASRAGEPNVEKYGKLIQDYSEIRSKSLEQIILDKFSPYLGMKGKDLSKIFGVESVRFDAKHAAYIFMKNLLAAGAYDDVDEFLKSDIKLKAVTVDENGMPTQDVSLPCFSYCEMQKVSWEDSDERFEFGRKYLFVFFKKTGGDLVFDSIKFWNMSDDDLQRARAVWVGAKRLMRKGLIVKAIKFDKNNKQSRETFFPTIKNEISQVRPHGLTKYTNPLPVPDLFTKATEYTNHSFWLNKKYVYSRIYMG